jgi:Zn-dependent protease with chaperone function
MPRTSEHKPVVLNPFPFLAETQFRLAVLVLLAISVALALGHAAQFSHDEATHEDLHVCIATVLGLQPFVIPQESDGFAGLIAALEPVMWRLLPCLEFAGGGNVPVLALGAVGLLGVLVAVQVALHSAVIVWRMRLQLPPTTVRQMLEARVTAIGGPMGISRCPKLYWAPLDGRARAYVFGSNHRPRLAVHYGAIAVGAAEPARLDALLAHELAHVANRDITPWIVSRAVLRAMLFGLAPLAVVALIFARSGLSAPWEAISEVLRLAGALGILALAQASVLRVRERAADVRASIEPAVRAALAEHVVREPARPAWRRLLDVYPEPRARLRGLDETTDLFRPPIWSAAAFGFALTVMCMAVIFVGLLWAIPWLLVVFGPGGTGGGLGWPVLMLLAPAALGALVSAALGPIAWRASFARALGTAPGGAQLGPVSGPALGAAAGATVGLFVSLVGGGVIQGAVPEVEGIWLRPTVNRGLLALVAFVVFLAFFGIQFLWMNRVATAWSAPLARHAWGARAAMPLAILAGLPFAVLAPSALLAILAGLAFGDMIAATGGAVLPLAPFLVVLTFVLVVLNPLAAPALGLVALLPLAAAAVRGGSMQRWIVLEGQPQCLPDDASLRPGRALLTGTALGAFWVASIFGTEAGPAIYGIGNAYAVGLLTGLGPGLAGLVGALTVPRLRFEHGVLACLTAAALVHASFLLAGLAPSAVSLWLDLVIACLVGIPLALLGAGLREGTDALLRGQRPRSRA